MLLVSLFWLGLLFNCLGAKRARKYEARLRQLRKRKVWNLLDGADWAHFIIVPPLQQVGRRCTHAREMVFGRRPAHITKTRSAKYELPIDKKVIMDERAATRRPIRPQRNVEGVSGRLLFGGQCPSVRQGRSSIILPSRNSGRDGEGEVGQGSIAAHTLTCSPRREVRKKRCGLSFS